MAKRKLTILGYILYGFSLVVLPFFLLAFPLVLIYELTGFLTNAIMYFGEYLVQIRFNYLLKHHTKEV